MSTNDAALARAEAVLRGCSPSAALDASLLLAHVLGCARGALAARGDQPLAAAQRSAFLALVERRAAGEPLAYLTGRRSFWTLDLAVTPAVLVPRPETELLIEVALAELRGRAEPTVLDLGTGSGAIALAIKAERGDAQVVAVDSSEDALDVARGNAAAAGAAVEFLRGSWYGPVAGRRFDAVLANPPYLAASDPHLPGLACEPRAALVAGRSGLEALEQVLAGASGHLVPGGFIAVEHGSEQAAAVRRLCEGGGLARVATHRDLAGHARVTAAFLPARSAPDR